MAELPPQYSKYKKMGAMIRNASKFLPRIALFWDVFELRWVTQQSPRVYRNVKLTYFSAVVPPTPTPLFVP